MSEHAVPLNGKHSCYKKCWSLMVSFNRCTQESFSFSSELKKSAPVFRSLVFSGKTWASVVGKPLPIVSLGDSAQFGSIFYSKPLPTFDSELEDCLKNIENSLTSLVEQIGKLAQRLDSLGPVVSQPSPGCQPWVTFPSQDHVKDIVMKEGSSGTTSGKAASKPDLSASLGVKKLESILARLFASVMSLTTHLDGLSLTGVAFSLSSFQ
ncbi:hypothetical protein G9A89_014793 [Geosiphon pyriformis]|nr:hypothetical protein G9A89_014793 [Geosiphon pyriformis]